MGLGTKTKQKQTNKVCQWQERAHNPEGGTPILGLNGISIMSMNAFEV